MAKKVSIVLSHWFNLIEGLQGSSQQFYSLLEKAIKNRKIPDLTITRINYKEGGIFSAKREYLRVYRKGHIFDICAAPYGKGYFVSWWLGETPPGGLWGLILLIPFWGPLLLRYFHPTTYYRYDTALMFQQSIHHSVLEVIDKVTKSKGIRALSELERKPILSSFFK